MDSREALIALNLIEHVGPVRARLLLEHFGDAPQILAAPKSALLRVRNIGDETAEAIATWEKTIDLAGELKRISDFGCHVLIQSDENYPASLREIYDPPLVLYVKGELTAKDKNAVAMVGSRSTTHYGIETARKLAYKLAYVGVTVVSGGVRGIDTAAHQGALAAKGRTVCVLGTGINIVFPPENAELFGRTGGERADGLRARHRHQYCVPARERGIVRAHCRIRRGHHAIPLQPQRRQTILRHPQPDHCRHDARHGCRGGGPAQRRAHHGEFCDGIWAAGFCRARTG